MKKVVLLAAFAVAALAANAQVLRNEFLKDYKPGDKLEKAVYRQMDWEGTIQADGEGRTSRRYIYICNAGEHSLFAGGLIEKTELFGNYFAKVKLEEAKKGVEGNEWNGTDFHE